MDARLSLLDVSGQEEVGCLVCAMPFSIATAPLVFTKLQQVVEVLEGHLHSFGVDAHIYCDNSLMLHMDQQALARSTRSVLADLLHLGFIPSLEEVQSSQDFVFLGYRFRSDLGLVIPPLAKFERASLLVSLLVSVERVQVC